MSKDKPEFRIQQRLIEKAKRFAFVHGRIEFLFKRELYLEMLLLSSQLIEDLLKDSLELHTEIAELTLDLSLIQRKYLKPAKLASKNLTLGNLINLFNKSFNKDDLALQLKEFNNLRNRIAHGLQDPEIDLEQVIRELRKFAKDFRVHDIILDLQQFIFELQVENSCLLMKKQKRNEDEILKFRDDMYKMHDELLRTL